MVNGEVFGQRDIDDDFLRAAAFGGRDDVEDLRADEATEEFEGALLEQFLFRGRFVAIGDDFFQRGAAVFGCAGKDVEKRVVVNGKEAKAVRENFAEWEVMLGKTTAGAKLTAHAEDTAGNVEPRPHAMVTP